MLESEEKDIEADFEAAEQVQRVPKHLANARAVLSALSPRLASGWGLQPVHAALVDAPSATTVAADECKICLEVSQTPNSNALRLCV